MQIRLALTVPETKDADKADTSLLLFFFFIIYFLFPCQCAMISVVLAGTTPPIQTRPSISELSIISRRDFYM